MEEMNGIRAIRLIFLMNVKNSVIQYQSFLRDILFWIPIFDRAEELMISPNTEADPLSPTNPDSGYHNPYSAETRSSISRSQTSPPILFGFSNYVEGGEQHV